MCGGGGGATRQKKRHLDHALIFSSWTLTLHVHFFIQGSAMGGEGGSKGMGGEGGCKGMGSGKAMGGEGMGMGHMGMGGEGGKVEICVGHRNEHGPVHRDIRASLPGARPVASAAVGQRRSGWGRGRGRPVFVV